MSEAVGNHTDGAAPHIASGGHSDHLGPGHQTAPDPRVNRFHEAHEIPAPYLAELGPGLSTRRHASAAAWALLSFGIATLMCGGVLMGWSFVGDRSELWTVGTPLALAGQALVLIGLVLQMDVIWQNSQDTSTTLVDIDDRISALRHTTLQVAVDPAGETKFIQHPAHEATPQMLIAELKGRLDLLSAQVARQDQDAC